MHKTAQVLAQAPDTKIALCHAGSPHDRSLAGLKTWNEQLRALSQLSQVTCKLSGLGMFDHKWTAESIRPILDSCLEQFGPDRVMFGSNFPVDKLYGDFASLVGAYRELIPAKYHEAVFRNTAARFYSLDNMQV